MIADCIGLVQMFSGMTAASIDVHFRYALTPMECRTFANRGGAYWILSGASQASRAADEVIEYGNRAYGHIDWRSSLVLSFGGKLVERHFGTFATKSAISGHAR
jgi:hypothetical protein